MSKETSSKTYRVEGLSCTNCAAKFEKNVKSIEGVTDAKVNFGAGKIKVEGTSSIQEIKSAGAFENLIIQDEGNQEPEEVQKESFLKRNWTLVISVILIAIAFYFRSTAGENDIITKSLFISAIVIGGFSLFTEGIKDLLKLNFSMEVLMTVAIIGASIIGEWAEGSIVVILFAVSEALERFSMDKARQSIRSLMDIAPKEALIRRGNKEKMINVSDIQIGDIMIIKPGQKIAMDGVVIKGHSAVNQAAITGESVPVEKQINDEIFAGTLNEEGILEVEVTKHVNDTTIAKIIHLVEEAQGERAPAQAFVDKFAKYYTPSIMAISALIIIIPPLLFGGDWNTWLYQGLSLLVVGCPCSLVISTPVSIVSAIGNSAKNGVLVKGGIYLEEIGGLKAIAFDKTGTLTKGTPSVTDFIVSDIKQENQYLSIISALELLSQHPLASAIIKEADKKESNYQMIDILNFKSVTGKGIKGDYQGTTYFVGSPKLFDSELIKQASIMKNYEKLQEQGKTVMIFGTEQNILAIIAVADELRESSSEVIAKLHQLGIEHTIMLTGDNIRTAKSIGEQVGVTDIKGDLMPQDKLDYIKE
ncbi:heavy metal translocating P-type ATPase, partial [Vagococcus fluvialis]